MTAPQDILERLANSSAWDGSHDLYRRCLDAAEEISRLRARLARITTWANFKEDAPTIEWEKGYESARRHVRDIGLVDSIAAIDAQISEGK